MAPASGSAGSGGSNRSIMIAGAVIVAIAAAAIAFFVFGGGGDDSAEPIDVDVADIPTTVGEPDAADEATTEPAATAGPAFEPTAAPEPTATREPTPEPTATTEPTPTVEPSPTPLPFPADTRRAELTDITLAGNRFEVGYDTLNFEPLIGGPGTYHLHFHWDIYPPTTVGTSSSPQNPWVVWDLRGDGDKIFDQLGPGDAPAGATAMCVVVANANHAVDNIDLADDTVSCIDLPG